MNLPLLFYLTFFFTYSVSYLILIIMKFPILFICLHILLGGGQLLEKQNLDQPILRN